MKILVTGGTGHLGQPVVAGLLGEGHQVRVMARRPRNEPRIEWVEGDLATGEGVREAAAGVDLIVHAATNSPAARRGRFKLGDFVHSPADVDVRGTEALLVAAEEAGVKRFVHVSTVGLEHMRRLPYSRRKLQAEHLVISSTVPWTIVRATGFYWLLARMLDDMTSKRLLALPAHVRMAPVDSDEFARFIVECVAGGEPGEAQDFAGPETLTMIELAEQYLSARGRQRRIRHAPMPTAIQRAMTAGNTSPGARRGTTTWRQWLTRRPGA